MRKYFDKLSMSLSDVSEKRGMAVFVFIITFVPLVFELMVTDTFFVVVYFFTMLFMSIFSLIFGVSQKENEYKNYYFPDFLIYKVTATLVWIYFLTFALLPSLAMFLERAIIGGESVWGVLQSIIIGHLPTDLSGALSLISFTFYTQSTLSKVDKKNCDKEYKEAYSTIIGPLFCNFAFFVAFITVKDDIYDSIYYCINFFNMMSIAYFGANQCFYHVCRPKVRRDNQKGVFYFVLSLFLYISCFLWQGIAKYVLGFETSFVFGSYIALSSLLGLLILYYLQITRKNQAQPTDLYTIISGILLFMLIVIGPYLFISKFIVLTSVDFISSAIIFILASIGIRFVFKKRKPTIEIVVITVTDYLKNLTNISLKIKNVGVIDVTEFSLHTEIPLEISMSDLVISEILGTIKYGLAVDEEIEIPYCTVTNIKENQSIIINLGVELKARNISDERYFGKVNVRTELTLVNTQSSKSRIKLLYCEDDDSGLSVK